MKKALLYLLLAITTVILSYPNARAQDTTPPLPLPTVVSSNYYTAKVIKVEPQPNYYDPDQPTNNVQVTLQIKGGKRNGTKVTALWNNDRKISRSFQVQEGSSLILSCTTLTDRETCDIIDQQRTDGLLFLLFVFLVVIWIVTRRRGFLAFLSMLLGLVVILFVIVPLIIRGWSPLLVTIIGAIIILFPGVYISRGFTMKSHLTLLSILGAVIIIGLLSLLFTSLLHLTGSTGEETTYLNSNINLRAVLFSAIILGALGVIDDIAMTQVSTVNELYHSNSRLSPRALFLRAMKVGQDHIASVINMLFLAYAGVSLPLLILIKQNGLPAFVAVQQEPIASEIMRTLVGTIGLILVVPLATYIAATVISRYPHFFPEEEHHHIH